MRRLVALLALIAALALPVSVSAYPGESRNETAVFGGPHCHTVLGTPIDSPIHPIEPMSPNSRTGLRAQSSVASQWRTARTQVGRPARHIEARRMSRRASRFDSGEL